MEAFAFEFIEYITDKALILIPVLLIFGAMLKATPKCPDWCIPWVLLAIGIALSVLMLGMHVDAVIQGALILMLIFGEEHDGFSNYGSGAVARRHADWLAGGHHDSQQTHEFPH